MRDSPIARRHAQLALQRKAHAHFANVNGSNVGEFAAVCEICRTRGHVRPAGHPGECAAEQRAQLALAFLLALAMLALLACGSTVDTSAAASSSVASSSTSSSSSAGGAGGAASDASASVSTGAGGTGGTGGSACIAMEIGGMAATASCEPPDGGADCSPCGDGAGVCCFGRCATCCPTKGGATCKP